MSERTKKVIALYDGSRSSKEIAEIVGLSPRYVRRIAKNHNLPRLPQGGPSGERNGSFYCGRRINTAGYAFVSIKTHPYANYRKDRNWGRILEHRLVMERKLGRHLLPTEIVDHIDGLTLHNDPSNLRIFESNGDHLRETISDMPRLWSKSGLKNIGTRTDLGKGCQRVDTYRLRQKSGDVRLRQILLAALKLGIDSPFLSGSFHHLEKAGIDYSSRSSLQRAVDDLYRRWEEALSL